MWIFMVKICWCFCFRNDLMVTLLSTGSRRYQWHWHNWHIFSFPWKFPLKCPMFYWYRFLCNRSPYVRIKGYVSIKSLLVTYNVGSFAIPVFQKDEAWVIYSINCPPRHSYTTRLTYSKSPERSLAAYIWARLVEWVHKPWLLLGKCSPNEWMGWHVYYIIQNLPIYI